ncbi:MAG: aromatic acid exporter family protein [Tissierellia bacterium]|nr:aromatic acid exporter family protein [Tissierellia bacterium]
MDFKDKLRKFNFKKFFKSIFGMRIIKTALATSIAIAIAHYFNLRTPLLAGISAVVSMTSSVFDSYMVSINRMLSTILGAVIASFFHFIGFVGFLPLAIGIIIIINICNMLKWKKSITLACIVFIVIMLYIQGESGHITYWQYGINRTLDTFVGLVVGFLINYLIFPPNRAKFLLETYKQTLLEFENAFKSLLESKNDIKIEKLIDDINEINSELKSIKNDRKLGANHNFKISQISRINNQFFTVFGLITQLSEDGHIPEINSENKKLIKEYYKDEIELSIDELDDEFETAFNYYLRELVETMNVLREFVSDFENNII